MIKEQPVSFKVAKLAKEKGFKNGSRYTYHDDGALSHSLEFKVNGHSNMTNGTEAPTQALLQKWLRDKPTPIIVTPITDFVTWEVDIIHPDKDKINLSKNKEGRWFNSYEEALEYGLLKGLKLIEL